MAVLVYLADAGDAANAADAGRPAPPAVTTRFALWQRVALAGIVIAAGAAWLWLPQSLDRAGNAEEIATTSSRARDCFASAKEYRQRKV